MRAGRALGSLAGLGVVAAVAAVAVHVWRTRNLGPVQRGLVAAEKRGCFGCHGAGGFLGFEGSPALGAVPALGGALQVRSPSEAEIRAWILDGRPPRATAVAASLREDEEEGALFRMPAFRDVLGGRELDDIVAYVKAIGASGVPEEGPVRDGHDAAARLGCFQCHGPGGRGDPPNPGSLKGYVPSWSGRDFPELCRDEAEVREWILEGRPQRLRDQRAASYFLDRQIVRMPAYRGRIEGAELEAILAYIRWLRRAPAPG